MIESMRREGRNATPTLIPNQGIFYFPHNMTIVEERLAFGVAVHLAWYSASYTIHVYKSH